MNSEEYEHQVKVAKWLMLIGTIGFDILITYICWPLGAFIVCAEMFMYGLYKLDVLGAIQL